MDFENERIDREYEERYNTNNKIWKVKDMIRAALIEDDKAMAEYEASKMESMWNRKEALKTEIFLSAESFIEKVKSDEKYEIIFADIELPGMNGIEMGNLLRELSVKVPIIFLTSHPGFALASYRLEAEQYVLKDEFEERMPEILSRICERIQESKVRCRIFQVNGEVRKIAFDEIIYFFKEGKYVRYITEQEEVRERISLDEVYQEVEGFPFVKTERGYVANLRWIKRITGDRIYMKNGDEIPVSRRLLQGVKEELIRNRHRL